MRRGAVGEYGGKGVVFGWIVETGVLVKWVRFGWM